MSILNPIFMGERRKRPSGNFLFTIPSYTFYELKRSKRIAYMKGINSHFKSIIHDLHHHIIFMCWYRNKKIQNNTFDASGN